MYRMPLNTTGVTPGSADVRLRWREAFPNNFLEVVAEFSECHTSSVVPGVLSIWDDLDVRDCGVIYR